MTRSIISLSVLLLSLTALGAGCWPFNRSSSYIEAQPLSNIQIAPNQAGALASTGGKEVTVTPNLDTSLLVASLPLAPSGCSSGDAKERIHPIPLPDGTRSEYRSVEREYTCDDTIGGNILVSISDTRGIPVLTAFMDSFQPFTTDGSRRSSFTVNTNTAWLTYTQAPAHEGKGSGNAVMLYRGRFLIQIDSSSSLDEDSLIQLMRAFEFTHLD